ncbi:hypothetical protein PS2_005561 [Malus domestica]
MWEQDPLIEDSYTYMHHNDAAVVKFLELEFVNLKLLIVLPMESYCVRCSAQGPVVNAGVSREDLCRLVYFVAYRTFVPLVGSATVQAVYPPISSQMRENFHIKRLKPLLDGVVISMHPGHGGDSR